MRYLFLSLLIFLLACHQDDDSEKTIAQDPRAAVVFSFDDTHIETWYCNMDLFETYNIKATFFLSNPYNMDSLMLTQLLELEQKGHEVAAHTMDHLNALDFLISNSLEEYMEAEILSSKDTMEQLGFSPVTFAYPYGMNNSLTDNEILKHFSLIRDARTNDDQVNLDQIDDIFYKFDGSKVVNAMGIDVFYGITIDNLKTGLQRAKDNQEALILYAHRVDDSGDNFTTSRAYLEAAFQAANDLEVPSERFKDLLE